MRVLQICHKVPFPPNDGGTLATYQLAKAMINMGWNVKMLSISTPKHPFQEMPLDSIFQKTKIDHVKVNTTPKPMGLISGLWSKNNYIVNRFNDDKFRELIKTTLEQNTFDIVIFEGIFTAPYIDDIREKSGAIMVLRTHNVEYQLWEERVQNEPNGLKRFLLQPQVDQLKDFELSVIKKFDVLATISMSDKAYFNSYVGLAKTTYVPFGISLPNQEFVNENTENDLVFLGALDWAPNLHGLTWFLEEVWPLILNKSENLTLSIGGRNAQEKFGQNLPKGVRFVGEVSDAHSFILSGKIMIVPLFEASGIRIKIIEGLALGQIICTTTKGVQGIKAQNNQHIIITDQPKQMAREIVDTLKSKEKLAQISHQARVLAENEFDITHTQKALLELVQKHTK